MEDKWVAFTGIATTTPTEISFGFESQDLLMVNKSASVDLYISLDGGKTYFQFENGDTVSVLCRRISLYIKTLANSVEYKFWVRGIV